MSEMEERYALIRCNKSQINKTQNSYLNEIVLDFGKQLIIGREMSCDLRLDSIEISRKHAVIRSEDNNWFITDLQSTNGVHINGNQLIAFTPYCLRSGDKVSFGPKQQSNLMYKFVDNYCPKEENIKSLKRKVETNDSQSVSKRFRNEWQQLFDSELSCSICHELFIFAVNLNCGHTFCQTCINQWKHSSATNHCHTYESQVSQSGPDCPVCRQPIVSQNRVLALDHLIDYMVMNSTPKLLEYRNQLIEERKQFNST